MRHRRRPVHSNGTITTDEDDGNREALHPFVYSAVIRSYARHGGGNGPTLAQALLSRMETSYLDDNVEYEIAGNDKNLKVITKIYVHPDRRSYSSVIDAYARRGGQDAGYRAEVVLRKMEDFRRRCILHSRKTRFGCKGSGKDGVCIDSGNDTDDIDSSFDDLYADVNILNSVLNAHARSVLMGQPRAAENAEQIVRRMEEGKVRKSTGCVKPDIITYNTLIMCWARTGISKEWKRRKKQQSTNCAPLPKESPPRRAEEILFNIEQSYLNGTSDVSPTHLTYAAVIQCWSKSGHPEGNVRADRILDRMRKKRVGKQLVQGDSNDDSMRSHPNFLPRVLFVAPTAVCLDAVMDAHARSGKPGSLNRVERLLAVRANPQGKDDAFPTPAPTTRSYAAAVLAHARCPGGNPRRAEKLLRLSGDPVPHPIVYGTAIGAWASSCLPGSATRAMSLLMEMVSTLAEEKGYPGRGTLIGNYAKAVTECAHACANDPLSGKEQAGRMESLFRSLLTQAPNSNEINNRGNKNGKSDYKCNNGNNGNSVRKMRQGKEHPPSIIVYNSIANAWASAADADTYTALRVESILRETIDLHREQRVDQRQQHIFLGPDIEMYTSAVHAWARIGNTNRAEGVIGMLMNDGAETEVVTMESTAGEYNKSTDRYCNSHVKPNVRTFTALLQAYVNAYKISGDEIITTKGGDKESISKLESEKLSALEYGVDSIIDRMQLLNIRPTSVTVAVAMPVMDALKKGGRLICVKKVVTFFDVLDFKRHSSGVLKDTDMMIYNGNLK